MRENFVFRVETGKHILRYVSLVIICAVCVLFGSVSAQSLSCASWGDKTTQLIQLQVGENKKFQLPKASVASNGASCVDDTGDIQYEVRRTSTPVLPVGFTFDEDDVTISGCRTTTVSSHKINLVATGPDACACTPATLEVVIRVKANDASTEAVCDATATPTEENSVDLDQTPPAKPFYGWSQVHLGERWTQPVGLDESTQGASITYGARCTGKYDLAENYIGPCPAFLKFIGQSKYSNGIVYFTEQISKKRSDIGIYRIRITAHKEDVAATSQTTVVLEVVDNHPAPESPSITAPTLTTLRLVWEVDEEERDYITGFDLEFRKVLGGRTKLYELANTITSLTIGSLEIDTQYQARLRIRGGRWSEWERAYTLGNNAPTFEEDEYSFSLTENVSGAQNRVRLGEVKATDPNPQDSVTYSLDSRDTEKFSIIAGTGVLYYIGDGEDHEATPTINVRVTATGGTGERALDSTVMVRVNVTNVSEPLAFADDAKIEVSDLTIGEYVDVQLPLAIGGDGAVMYSVDDPDLPDDLEVEARTGKLKGHPTVTTKRITYTYTATDVEGEADSLSFSLRVFGKAPKAPINLAVQRTHADRITFVWENPSTPFVPVVEHEIEYRKKGTSRWNSKRIDAPATRYTISGLTRNTTYQIRVKNFAQSGHVGFSDILEATTQRYAPPTVPRNVMVVDTGAETLTVEWDKPSDNGGRRVAVYDVRYRKKGTNTWTEEESRETTFTITGLEQGTEYLIGVRAVNIAGTGPWSEDLSATTIENTQPIFDPGASIPSQSYKVGEAIAILQLPRASEGDGNLVYSLAPSIPSGLQFNPNVLTLSGTPSAVQATTTYTYTVGDSDNFTEDDESHLTFEITVAANTPVSPALMIEDVGYESVVIIWAMPDSRGSNITTYDIELRQSGRQSNTTQQPATVMNFTATNLLPQTMYEVRIRANNEIGPSDWSAWTVFTTTKVPVEIRSRPLLHGLGVAGTMLGESAVERIGSRAILVDATQRKSDEDYEPPYYFRESNFSPVPKFGQEASSIFNQHTNRSSVDSYSRLLSLLPRSANFVLNNTNGVSDAEEGIAWSAWGSFDTTRRDANPMDVVENMEIVSSLEAQTTSIWLGAEFEVTEDVRVGIAASRATGDVDLDRIQNGTTSDSEKDSVEFAINSLHPYAVGRLHEQLSVWGTLGRGTGSTTLSDRWGEIDDLGLTATVLAAGVHFNFNENEGNGFALKGDLFQSDVDTDAADVFDGELSNSVRRLRVGVQGRRDYSTADLELVVSGEFLGRFEDGGVADGTNIDIGGEVDVLFNAHWSASGQLRIVRSIEADAYQAFGIQFDVRRDSTADGSGLSFQFTPSWGSAPPRERSLDLNLPVFDSFDSPTLGFQTEIEFSYGISSGPTGLIAPFGSITRFGLGDQLQIGVRVTDENVGLGRVVFDVSSFATRENGRANTGLVIDGRLTF